MHRTITVFAASADHLAPIYMDSAWRLGTLLAAQERVLVFGGGVIPDADIPGLKAAGIAEVFTPGTPTEKIIEYIKANVK